MKTDYQNLNLFEFFAVFFVVIGIGLTCTILFTAFNDKQQSYFISALDVFDIHEEAMSSAQSVAVMKDVPQEYFNQFYIAFSQITEISLEDLDISPDIILVAYAAMTRHPEVTSQQSQFIYNGEVAGASIDMENLSNILPPGVRLVSDLEPPNMEASRTNPPFDLSDVTQKLINFYKK